MDAAAANDLMTAADSYEASAALTRDYQSIIGGLMFAAICTRPDIAFAVNRLSRYCSNPDCGPPRRSQAHTRVYTKRRKLHEIPSRQRWRCANSECLREYKRTSTTSIAEHKRTCRWRALIVHEVVDINTSCRAVPRHRNPRAPP